jgi:hypothetical protein
MLRQAVAGRLVMARVNLKTAPEVMGYRTMAMTVRSAHPAQSEKLNRLQLVELNELKMVRARSSVGRAMHF